MTKIRTPKKIALIPLSAWRKRDITWQRIDVSRTIKAAARWVVCLWRFEVVMHALLLPVCGMPIMLRRNHPKFLCFLQGLMWPLIAPIEKAQTQLQRELLRIPCAFRSTHTIKPCAKTPWLAPSQAYIMCRYSLNPLRSTRVRYTRPTTAMSAQCPAHPR